MSSDADAYSVAEMWDRGRRHTRNHVKQYLLNEAYLEGNQWLQFDRFNGQVALHIEDDADRIQFVGNHMRANLRTQISQLTQRELSFEVMPTAADDATIRAAKTAEAILRELQDAHSWEMLREDLMKATYKGGTAALCVDWSHANETTVETVVGITEFVVEPGARDCETARWWIKAQNLPPEQVQAMFPSHFEDEIPDADGVHAQDGAYDYRQANDEVPLTRVLTYYERPYGPDDPGKVCVEVNGKIMEEGDWPFPFTDRLNFKIARESTIENKCYGTTILSDVRSPQTALNAAWSSYLEHLREASTNRIIADESWIDAIETMNDRPGAPLIGPTGNGKATPSWMKAPTAPHTITDAITMLKMEIDNLMGVHDVSRGQAPTNIESGYGLSILAEKDSSPVGRLIKESARVFSGMAEMVLMIHEQMVKKERTSVVRLSNYGPTKRTWTGKSLMGQTKALVPLEAIIPKSRAAQQAFADQAVQMGLISGDDPLALLHYARLADMPDRRSMVQNQLPDVAKAIRENEATVLGEIPLPREFDEHEQHLKIHNDFRKTPAYEELSEEDQSVLDDHMRAHEMMMQEAIADQRMGEAIDPALGQAPRADGAPPLPPLPPEEMPPPMPEGDILPEEIPPEQVSADLMAALEEL